MKVYVLVMADRDMRPRSDVLTTAVFSSREAAISAMEHDINDAIENGQAQECEIERNSGLDYAASFDGRFSWKIEVRTVCGCKA